MIALLLIVPIIFSMVIFVGQRSRPGTLLVLAYAAMHASATIWLIKHRESFTAYFRVDDLNILFLAVMSAVFLAVALYGVAFFKQPDQQENVGRHWKYNLFLLLFVDSMNGVLLSAHIGVLWIFVEASTLSTAILINYYGGKSALEATWKYIFICSIGISFAFIGIIFMAISCNGTGATLFWEQLDSHAKMLNPFWLKLSLPFLLLGFGTKMGLAPMHNWLPDAHSEAPAPISAILSAALLNVAFIGILRVHRIMNFGGLINYSNKLLLLIGFMSILIPTVFILRAKNYKRMLAYSSVENMGIIAIGVGLGGVALFAALLHMVGHSLIKAAFFLTSGNIYSLLRSKEIKDVKGLLKISPALGWLWIGAAVGICAFPPFVTFISEFIIIRELMRYSPWLLAIFCLLLTVIMFGICGNVLKMSFGESGNKSGEPVRPAMLACFPQIVMLSTALLLGLYIPESILRIIKLAAAFVGGL